jgi:hypothetical protein
MPSIIGLLVFERYYQEMVLLHRYHQPRGLPALLALLALHHSCFRQISLQPPSSFAVLILFLQLLLHHHQI